MKPLKELSASLLVGLFSGMVVSIFIIGVATIVNKVAYFLIPKIFPIFH
jgi:flagellar biosynthesis protein FliQ